MKTRLDFHSNQGAATASEYVGGASGSGDKVGAFSRIKLWLEDSADTWHSCTSDVTTGLLVRIVGADASSDILEAGSFLANLNNTVEIEKSSKLEPLTKEISPRGTSDPKEGQ